MFREIFEGDTRRDRCQRAMEAGASTGARTTRFMMEGVGARVIRGPEWKWGKQVRVRG